MSITTSRKNMVSTLLDTFEKHIQIPEPDRDVLTGDLYLRGDLDELYQEIIDQIETRVGHERGLETRSKQVVAKYLIGKHYRYCVLEVHNKPPLKENHCYHTVRTYGNNFVIIEH